MGLKKMIQWFLAVFIDRCIDVVSPSSVTPCVIIVYISVYFTHTPFFYNVPGMELMNIMIR